MLKYLASYLLPILLLALILTTSALAQEEKKIAYCVLLDNTGSMTKQFPQVLALGKAVVKRIHQRGPMSLFGFIPKRDDQRFIMRWADDAVYEGGNYDWAVAESGSPWSQDAYVLDRYIDSLAIIKGNTALFEAIQSMAEALDMKARGDKNTSGDRVIILITDGEHRMEEVGGSSANTDDEMRKRRERLIKRLKESGIRVYAVGLIRELNAYGVGMVPAKEKAESFLKMITKETGGRVVFPKSKQTDSDAILDELLPR